jgi:tetratricopeptide (TPR) repeat protein
LRLSYVVLIGDVEGRGRNRESSMGRGNPMQTSKRTIIWSLVLILAIAAPASAIRKGRLVGRVVDPDDNPIAGVTVTATSEQLPTFRVVETTDKKGVFKIDFEEINIVYRYKFEKAGYQTTVATQTWRKDGTARHDFVMQPGESPNADGTPPVSASNAAIAAFNEGVRAFEAKDHATAELKFEEALGRDPELRQGWGALSVIELEQGHYEEAAEAAEKAIELGSTNESILRTRWEAYRQLGDEAKTAAALEDLQNAGRAAEEAKKIHNEGVRLAKAGDNEAAFEKFQEAVTVDANLQVALLGVATTGLKIGRNEEAYAAAQTILKEDPQNEQALRLRYNASLGLHDEDLIVEALVGLTMVEPTTARDGLLRLALAAYDAQDVDRAKERFGKVLEVDPTHARCHYYLGLISVNEGANYEAVRHFERFIELAPDDPDAATAGDLVKYLSGS